MKQWAEQHIRGDQARFPVSQNFKNVLEMMNFSLHSCIIMFCYVYNKLAIQYL
jgi:hypothetical protein